MKTLNWIYGIALVLLLSIAGCQRPQPVTGTEGDVKNEFTYGSDTYSIGSVVRFDQDNHTVQFWISEEEGLETVEQVESNGDYLILSTHKSFIGSRDRFTKTGSFVRYGRSQYMAGDEGMGYIETSLTDQEITILFAVENMELKGSYKGAYSVYQEEPLVNEYSLDRKRASISDASVILREDGGSDTYTFYDSSNRELLEFSMPQDRRGMPTLFNTTDEPMAGVSISYGGKSVDMNKAFGSITAIADEAGMRVSFDITSGTERIRAEYDGKYNIQIKKANRYIYYSGYPYGSGYDGAFMLSEIRIKSSSNGTTYMFIPDGVGEVLYSDVPELTITDNSLIGKENIDMRNTPGWAFKFDKIIVECYENEWKPAPMQGSIMSIVENENGMYVNIELVTKEPSLKYISTIDLHFDGPVRKIN